MNTVDTTLQRLCRSRLLDDASQAYWWWAPDGPLPPDTPLLVAVHGISRNAGALARAFVGPASHHRVVLLAPHFSRKRFPDYQRLGRPDRLGCGERADHMLDRIVAELRARLGLSPTPLHLFGHSGGAQFTLRYLLTQPANVRRYVLSAAGAYAWPCEATAFPFGWGRSKRFADVTVDAPAVLALAGRVFVGDRDVERQASLRRGGRVDRQQGVTRVERALRWVEAMRRLAQQDVVGDLGCELLADCGHGFSECAARGKLAWRSADFLLSSPSALKSAPSCGPGSGEQQPERRDGHDGGGAMLGQAARRDGFEPCQQRDESGQQAQARHQFG